MKNIYLYLFAAICIITSCGPGTDNQSKNLDSVGKIKSAIKEETTVPGAEKLQFTDTISLQANENMRFDKELFRVRAGKKIQLLLKNTSAKSNMSMTHNVVVLSKGTDMADFADVARSAKNEGYVPSSVTQLVLAHTKMVSGGESDQISFVIAQPGVYDFICSFPGHWGTMQGKIVAE